MARSVDLTTINGLQQAEASMFAVLLRRFDKLSAKDQSEIREAAINVNGDGVAEEDQWESIECIKTKLFQRKDSTE